MRFAPSVLPLRQVVLLFVFSVLAACGESLPPDELLTRAATALAEGRDADALIDVRAAQQQEPQNIEARRLMAEIEIWRQNPVTAIEEVERAIDETAPSHELLVTYARALVKSRRYSDFDVLISEGVFDLVRDDPRYLANLARAQDSWGEHEKARATAARALDMAGDDPDVVTAYAFLSLEGQMTLGEALDRLKKTATQHPLAYEVWSTLGILQSNLGNYEAAAEASTEALRANPYRLIDRFLRAQALIRSARYDEALAAIDDLKEVVPDSPQVDFLRAQWHIGQDRFEEALENVNNVLSISENNQEALLLAAIANSALNNLQTARRQWLALDSMNAYQPEARVYLARVQARLGETPEAEKTLRAVLEENPMNIGAKRLLAAVLVAQGMNAESSRLYEELLAVEPDSSANLVSYSAALSEAGERSKAIEQLKAAVALNPESTEIRAQLATLLFADDRADEAQAEIERYLAEYPDNAAAHALAGRVVHARGESGAAAHYERALELEPGNKMANNGLAQLALEQGDRAGALARYRKILETEKNDLNALMRIAGVQMDMQDAAAMEATLQQALEAHPNTIAPRISLARYYVASQRHNDTVRLLSTFEGDGKEDPRLHLLLAGSYMALGETTSAIAATKRIQNLNPESPQGYVLEARALGQAGRLGDAADALREALERIDDPVIRAELITVLLLDENPDAARAVFDAADEDAFGAANTALIDGQIKAGANDLDAAGAAFIRAYEIEPREQTATLAARAYWRSGEQNQAIDVLNDWLQRDAESLPVMGQLSAYLLERGDNAAALPLLRDMNTRAPNQVSVLNNLAWASLESDAKQSLEWAQQARALAPDNDNVADTLSLALAANGDAEQALAMNDKLLQKAPRNSAYVISRARILGRLGQTQQAIQLLDSLLARDSSVSGAQALRDELAAQ